MDEQIHDTEYTVWLDITLHETPLSISPLYVPDTGISFRAE